MGVEMHAYSQDLRDRVLRALERKEGPTEIARRLEVSRVWVHQVQKRLEQDGIRSSLPMGGYRVSRVADKELLIRGWIKERKGKDMTLAEVCERLVEHGVSIKPSALWHQLDKWNLTFKKNTARQRARARGRASSAGAVAGKSART
jgi:transposase